MKPTMNKIDRLIVWIRRELRLNDHLALYAAQRDAAEVIPLLILGDDFARMTQPKQAAFRSAIRPLRERCRAIGGDLIIRQGDPATVLFALMRETGAGGIYVTSDEHSSVRAVDAELRTAVEAEGKLWKEFKDHVIFGPEEILTAREELPYTVFTPYRNAWQRKRPEIAPPLPDLRQLRVPDIAPGDLPPLPRQSTDENSFLFRDLGGEETAVKTLKSFLANNVFSYNERRDFLAESGTSRLSHHLAIGTLSIRTAYGKLLETMHMTRGPKRHGLDAFLDQLIWREFYYQILANFPHVEHASFQAFFDSVPWQERPLLYSAWCHGLTGYPIVDAAMRQLNHEGWMHNRGRMIVASFLTKDLHVHWRQGEEYFQSKLIDADVPLNNGGWQWAAGSGTDAQPWFRIFNPALQGKKFDPTGAYVRRYVPELARVPDRFIHEPWTMPAEVQRISGCRVGKDYPLPVVDHAKERQKTVQLFSAARTKRHRTPQHALPSLPAQEGARSFDPKLVGTR